MTHIHPEDALLNAGNTIEFLTERVGELEAEIGRLTTLLAASESLKSGYLDKIKELNEAVDTLRELREFDRKVIMAKLDRILEVLGAR